MTVRALMFALLLFAAPVAAQVGYSPDRSPFEDLRGRQALTVGIGSINPARHRRRRGPG